MSFAVIEEVMKQLRSIKYKSWIELAGRGESTLHPQFLEIVDKCVRIIKSKLSVS